MLNSEAVAHNSPSTRTFSVTYTLSEQAVHLLEAKAVDEIFLRIVERVVNELSPAVQAHVTENLDYDAITRSVQTALQARLLQAQLAPFPTLPGGEPARFR